MARLVFPSEPIFLLFFVGSNLILFNLASAGPAGQRSHPICSTFCREPKNFVYDVGKTYLYDYVTDIETRLIQGTQHKSHVRMSASVEMDVVSMCDIKLRLKNVLLEDQNSVASQTQGSSSFKEQQVTLEQYSMLFGFQDGKIESICPNQEDPVWAINVKRGILSMLQNSMEDLSSTSFIHEIDVNGKCPTEYIADGASWSGGMSFKKFKDLTKCNSRQSQLSSIQSTPYSSSSPVQNIPLLAGKLECAQTVQNKRIENVQCKEEQRFQPYEEDNGGAITSIAQSLIYNTEYRSQRQGDEPGKTVKKSLLFEMDVTPVNVLENTKQLLQALEGLHEASFPEVNAQAPQLFADFVVTLRSSSESSLRSVYNAIRNTPNVNFLMEALPLVGTASSLAFLRDLTMNNTLADSEQRSWLTSLAFIKYPTVEMIQAVMPLLQTEAPTMEAFLGISSLVNSYCKYQACGDDVVINEILETIILPLGNDCRIDNSSPEAIRNVVLRLKAIGNTGVLPVSQRITRTPTVMQCAQLKDNPLEVRLAAVDSLRRLPCHWYDNQDVLSLFMDVRETTEIRITSFVSLMRCVDRPTMDTVKIMLFGEPVNQVASFVWTYLTNLQETNRPEKQDIRDLMSNEFLKNKFSTDSRKFSRNYEASKYWEDWNVGAGIDSNIIFTEESFLPKSAMLNLTVQLFGESVNLFELGMRVHGMETILEKFFGPGGYLPDERVSEFLSSSRKKRDTTGEMQDDSGIGYLYDQAKPEVETVPGGSVYTRMFGHEVTYKTFEVADSTAIPRVVDDTGKHWFNIRHILDNLSTGKSSEFSKSMVLLDTKYSVATSAGFPLSLGVHSASTVTMVAKGKFNVGRFLETRELDIEGTLKPSAIVNVDGTLSLQIGRGQHKHETGLKLHNSIRSSTGFEMKLLIKGKHLFQAAFNVPQARQDIIDVSSQVFMIGPNSELPVVAEDSLENYKPSQAISPSDTRYASTGCTSQYFSEIVGMKLCMLMDIPNKMSFSPVRPVFMKFYLEKIDDFTGYTVDYRFNRDDSITSLSAVIDTPGSAINRWMSAEFLLDRGLGKIVGSLEGAETALRAEGLYTRFQKSFEVALLSQEKPSFSLSMGLVNEGNTVKPHFLVTWHSKPLMDLKGTIDMTPQANNEDRMAIEMNLKHLTETPVKVTGEIIGSGEVKEASLAIESYILTGNVRSQLKRKQGHWSTKTSMEYSWKRGKVHTADLSSKIQRTKKGSLGKVLVTAGFTSTQFPDNTLDFYWETQTSSGFCENALKVGWGKTTWEGHILFSRQYQVDHSELRLETSLQCSKFNVDYRLEFAHRLTTEGFKTKFLGRVATDSELNFNAEYMSVVDDLLKKSLEGSVNWPNTDYSLKASFLEKARGDFEAELLVHLNNTKDLKATAMYINRSNNLRLDHNVDFRARGFTPVPLSGSIGFSATEKQSHVGLQLQFEGKKPYSSRISTSFDYSHTKYSHKLEGKVTINEKKYNGEILYINNRVGAKNLTLDLQLENHIFVEATLNGMLPSPMRATLKVVPDKDVEPDSQIRVEANVDPNSAAVMVHYFGDEVRVGGSYNDTSVSGEVIWPTNKQILVSVAVPRLSFEDTLVEIDALTPFEGYENIDITFQHSVDENSKMNTSMTGVIGTVELSTNLYCSLSSNEINVSTDVSVSDYPRFESKFVIIRKSKRKSLQILMGLGEKQSTLDFDFVRLDEGYNGKFILNGCPFLPAIALEANHQFSASMLSTYTSAIEWGEAENDQKLAVQIKHQVYPLSVEALVTTPWTSARSIESSLTWDSDSLNRKVSVTCKDNNSETTVKLQLNVVGSSQNFRHELDLEWYSQPMRMTVSGGLNGFVDSNLHILVKLPNNHLSYDILSKKESPEKYIGEFRADINDAITAGGVKWTFSGERSQDKVVSVWLEVPRYTPVSATIELSNTGTQRDIKLLVNKRNDPVVEVETSGEFAGLYSWKVDFLLKSDLKVLPSINFNSHHDLTDFNKIRHSTKGAIVPLNEETFWLNQYLSARKASLSVSIDNLEDIQGSAVFGNKDFMVNGKLEQLENDKYSTNLKISSNHFHELTLTGTYQANDDRISLTTQVNGHDGHNLMNLALESYNTDGVKSLKGSLTSASLPDMDALISISTVGNWNVTSYFTMDSENVFRLEANGAISLFDGLVRSKLSSVTYPSIGNLQLEVDYKVSSSEAMFVMMFVDNEKVVKTSLTSEWGGPVKSVTFTFEGPLHVQVQAALNGWSELVAHAFYNREKQGEITISYRPEQGQYSLGKHGVYMKFIGKDNIEYQFNVIGGLDIRKNKRDSYRVYLKVQTPFSNWTNVVVDGQTYSNSDAKGIKFSLEREDESIKGSFESRKKGLLNLNADLAVNGFSKLRQIILETTQTSHIKGLSAKGRQNFNFQLTWQPKEFKINIQTPVEFLKKLALNGKWELASSPKFVTITGEINESQYELKSNIQHEEEVCKGTFSIVSANMYTIQVGYDFTTDYETNLSVETPEKQWNLGGKIIVKPNLISITMKTPFQNYETISMSVEQEYFTDTKGSYSLDWNLNGQSDKIALKFEIEQGRVEVRVVTPFEPWNTVVMTVIYDNPFKRLKLHAQRGDGQEVKVNFDLDYSGSMVELEQPASSSVLVSIETPIENFEDIKLELLYNRDNMMHTANVSVSRNDGKTEGKLNLMFQHSDPVALDISAFLTSPFLASKATAHASLLVDPNGESTLSAHVQARGKRYEMYALSQLTSAVTKLEMRTSLPFLRHVKVAIRQGDMISMHGAWAGNNKHVEVNGDILVNGIVGSKASFNVSTPMEFVGSFGFDGEVVTKAGTTNAKLVFQNHEVRWLAKLDRTKESVTDAWRLQLNTPLTAYKHVVISLKHGINGQVRNVEGAVYLNNKEMSMQLLMKPTQLDMQIASELSLLPVKAKVGANWEEHLILAVSTNTGNREQGSTFRFNLDGMSQGSLDCSISSMQQLNTTLEWKFQGDGDEGHGQLTVTNPLIGRKSVRSSWKNQDWKEVTFDMWVKTESTAREKGVSVQYNVRPQANYGSIEASANYTLDDDAEMKSILFSGTLDEQASFLAFDSVLKTPFDDFEVFSANGHIKIKNEIVFKAHATLNDAKLASGSLQVAGRPLNSSISLHFDVPLITQPISIAAMYDMTGNKKNLGVSFNRNEHEADLTLQVTVPEGGNDFVDIKLQAESTVPSMPLEISGNLRVEYAVNNDGMRQLSLLMGGNEIGDWKLLASLRPTSNFSSKLVFDGPLDALPSLLAELNINTGSELSSNFTAIFNGLEVTSIVNLKTRLWEANFKYIDAEAYIYRGDGKVVFDEDNTQLDVEYVDGDSFKVKAAGYLNLTAESKLAGGIVTIKSGNIEAVPVSLEIVIDDGSEILIVGSSNEKECKVQANLRGVNGASWKRDGESYFRYEGWNPLSEENVSFELKSTHFARDGEYSLNATVTDKGSFVSYLTSKPNPALLLKAKLEHNEEIVLTAQFFPSSLHATLRVPGYADAEFSSEYGYSDQTTYANGYLILNGQKSFLNSSLVREGSQSVCRARLEIPFVRQKVDMEIITTATTSHNVRSHVNLKVNDQRFELLGSLKTQVFESVRGDRYIERFIKLSTNITTGQLNTIDLDIFLRKPLRTFENINTIVTLSVNDMTTSVSGGYELPNPASGSSAAIHAKLESNYFPVDESYEFFLKSFGKSMKKIEGKLNYKSTRFDILWDFLLQTSVFSVSYSSKMDDGERLLLQTESILNVGKNVKFSLNCHGWDTHYTLRTSLTRETSAIIGHLFIDAPQILASTNEYKVIVTTNEDNTYSLEASVVRGRLVMELVGDGSLSSTNVNMVVKAMGSYGSHYAMLVGNRNIDGQYGFELTAESSSLLVGKRVNIRGNMTVEARSVNVALQCRAKRSIHEMSLLWTSEETGAGKLTVNLNSPSRDPASLSAEWSSASRLYFGKLVIQLFGANHQAEFGVNVMDFEGKLNIVSPLLPSNEFNFHVKSIVAAKNVDVMGDIKIRGSHWKLEGVAALNSLYDMIFKIEVRTPFAFFDRLTLGIKCVQDEIYLEVHTPVTYIPNAMFQLGGIQAIRQGRWHELKPNLVISVPNGKYTAIALFDTPQYQKRGLLHILLQFIGDETKTVEAYAEISPLNDFNFQMNKPGSLEVRFITPFDWINEVGLKVDGEIHSRQGSGKLEVSGKYNQNEGKFDASFDNRDGNMQAVTRLTTNIPNYEKSAFAISIESFQGIGKGQSFHVEFMKPDWDKMFRIDADYRYNMESFYNIDGEVNLNMDSYMNLPPLHAKVASALKSKRYDGALEASFGVYKPALKIEGEYLTEKIVVLLEGKAGENDRYLVSNLLEILQQEDFSFKEQMKWKNEEVLNVQLFLSNEEQLCEGHASLVTPWGTMQSKAALTPITFMTMDEDLSMSQLLKNANITFGVNFDNEKVIGLDIVSKDGMRVFEVYNPLRPVSLSIAVEKVDWHSLRMKAGVCWNLKYPQRSSLGLDIYAYKRSTGLSFGGYVAGAEYGIVTLHFEHLFTSSKLAQNLMIKWNQHSGKLGDFGYSLNVTDKLVGFRRVAEYAFRLVIPSRAVLISGNIDSLEDKSVKRNLAVAWDAVNNPEKVLKVILVTERTSSWRTSTVSQVLQLEHVAWSDPMTVRMDKSLVHDNLRDIAIKVMPSMDPSSHLEWSASWENNDWSCFSTNLLQTSSKIDSKAIYNISDMNQYVKIDHMLATGEYKRLKMRLDRNDDSLKFAIQTGNMENPTTVSSLNAKYMGDTYTITGALLSYQLSGRIRASLPYLDLILRQKNTHNVHVMCGLTHPKEIVFKASRSEFTRTINDVTVMIRLNSSNLLSTRINWRPELADEIAEYDWLKASKNLLSSLVPSFPEFTSAIRSELEGHWNLFSSPVKHFIGSFYQLSMIEVKIMLQELQVIGSHVQQLYSRNAFYLKDLYELVKASVSPLLDVMKNVADQLKEMCKLICQQLMNLGTKMSNLVVKYYGRLETHIMQAWENAEDLIVKLWTRYAERLQEMSEELEEFIDALVEALEGKIDMLEEKLKAIGFVRTAIQLYRDYITWLDEIPLDDYVEAIEDFFQIKVWDKLEALLGPYLEAVRNGLDDEYIRQLLETPPIPYIRFLLIQTKNALVRVWNVVEFEQKVKDLLRHGLKNLDVLMQRNFPSWDLNWDFDSGIIEYDQSLSFFDWADFTKSPQWRIPPQEADEVNQITNLYYQIMDYVENLKPIFDLRIRDVLPPFGSFAMMAGDHHYYTFDKKYFRFAGECSYVLVADLLHNSFSFIVNYEWSEGAIRKKSYSIVLPDHTVEFDVANFKVTIDNKKAELPTKVDSVYIRRQETKLDIYDIRGYEISCTLSPSVCTFTTSGWYFGKLAGLLGTYDNELINDFRSPDGDVIADVPTFAYSWRVGKTRNQCRIKNFVKEEAVISDVDNICYDLLSNRNSPLRPCFNTVDTEIFMEMCKYDVSKNINSANRAESACTSMSAYVTECQKRNIDVWMPPTCVRCKLEDGTALTTGENATLQTNSLESTPPTSADVVVLLEEQDCMDQLDIFSAITKLEAALKAEGLTDNRYAMVGFGGEGIHYDAHLQTTSSNVWSHSTLFKVPEKGDVVGARASDLYSAIHFASTMTYRAGVSKTFIAITCGDDKCGDPVRYSDTLTLLIENDFKMHMIVPKPFTLKEKKKQDAGNRILGFDANGVYTTMHAKRDPLIADASFKRHLNLPKDLCTPLAVETNGTRFTSDNLTKKNLDVWARRVAQTASPSECQRCECVPDRNGGSRLMCHQCVSPTLWSIMEEWKNYQSQEVDDVFGLEILESEPFLIAPH